MKYKEESINIETEKILKSDKSKEINDLDEITINVGTKVFKLIYLERIISDFLLVYKKDVFIKNYLKDVNVELNKDILLKIASNLGISLRDFIKSKDVRNILKNKLGFKENDRLFVKDNRVFILENKQEEKRYNGFNKIQLENIISELSILGDSKEEFIRKSIINNLNLKSFSKTDLREFLTKDFKKYVKTAILESIHYKIQDKEISNGISSLIYRDNFEEINSIITSRLEELLKNTDYLEFSHELKDKILDYYNISDKIFLEIITKSINKFKVSFNRVFLSNSIPSVLETERYHSTLEGKIKKVFISYLESILDSKIGYQIDKTLKESILLSAYSSKRNTIKYGISKYILDIIMYNSDGNTAIYRIQRFFNYYFLNYRSFKLNFPSLNIKKTEKNNHHINIYNELVSKIKEIYKTKNKYLKLKELSEKNIAKKNSYRLKLSVFLKQLENAEEKYKLYSAKRLEYQRRIKALEKDFFRKKELEALKKQMQKEDIIKKEGFYLNLIRDKKSSISSLKASINFLNTYETEIEILERKVSKNEQLYKQIILDVSRLILEQKKDEKRSN